MTRQPLDIPRAREKTVDAVRDDLRRAALRGGDHRQAGGHALDDDLAERLGNDRGVHEAVDLGQHARHIVEEARELHLGSDPETVHERMQLCLVLLLPEHRAPDHDGPGVRAAEGPGEGLQEDVLALPRRQTPDHRDPEPIVRRDVTPGPRREAARRGSPSHRRRRRRETEPRVARVASELTMIARGRSAPAARTSPTAEEGR